VRSRRLGSARAQALGAAAVPPACEPRPGLAACRARASERACGAWSDAAGGCFTLCLRLCCHSGNIPLLLAAGKLVIHGVHHVGVLISDLERSLKFYTEVLGVLLPLPKCLCLVKCALCLASTLLRCWCLY